MTVDIQEYFCPFFAILFEFVQICVQKHYGAGRLGGFQTLRSVPTGSMGKLELHSWFIGECITLKQLLKHDQHRRCWSLRPGWHHDSVKGIALIIMTGSVDNGPVTKLCIQKTATWAVAVQHPPRKLSVSFLHIYSKTWKNLFFHKFKL